MRDGRARSPRRERRAGRGVLPLSRRKRELMITAIEGGTVVAYEHGRHRIVPGGTVVFENDRITFVGRRFPAAVDRRLDATGRLVIPGFVNLHCHADTEAGGRLVADAGRRDFFHTGFLNY